MGYADDFPEVEATSITVAPGMREDGEQVQALLGAGVVVEDQTMEADHMVVVLGKDFDPGSTVETQTTE
jgi:hypothetical protein